MKPFAVKFSKLASLLVLIVFFATGCSKDDNSSGGYPKNVTIEYKLTPSAGITVADVGYTNETNAVSTLFGQALPFTKQITRTVNKLDNAGLTVTAIGSGNIKMEIFVDGNLVKTETPSSTSVVQGTIAYVFQ